MDLRELEATAYRRRLEVLDMVYASGSGHIGGDMSCMDALTVLFYDVMDVEKMRLKAPDADHFILSKGHCAEALYAVLADRGFFDKSRLNTFAQFGTRLAEHPTHGIEGVDIATGSLGHGLSAACGMALGYKRSGTNNHIYVLMGDGEQAEGSVWEAAMFASKYGLDNLTAMIDRNRLQISGWTEDVMPLGELAQKYAAFGWNVVGCDGHDYLALRQTLRTVVPGRPTAVILETIKGKGVDEMENKAEWHHRIPSGAQYRYIRQKLQEHLQEVAS